MAVRRILQLAQPADAERLRRRSVKVRRLDPDVKQLLTDMVDTFNDNAAYGLAAPQIGEFYRVIVLALGEKREQRVVINPEIVKVSADEIKDYDGCLSIPSIYGDTRRAGAIVLQGRDPDWRVFRLRLEGFDARIAQHEVDHLDGVLFIDRLDDLADLYSYKSVPVDGGGEGETELQEVELDPEKMALVRRTARPLPTWALRW